MVLSHPSAVSLARALRQAEATATPIAALTESDPDLTIQDAYAIQALNLDIRLQAGARLLGRKIGLTSRAMQEMLGVEEPDYGALLDDMFVEEGDVVDLNTLIAPRIEGEMAFILEHDLTGPGITAAAAARAIAGVMPALEIIDSRVANWKIKLVDTVADNASCGRIVIPGTVTSLRGLDLRLTGMALSRNGAIAATGAGAAVLGSPVRCVAWLANKLGEFGHCLRAGDVVLAGALHGAIDITAGDVIRAEFAHLGAITTSFNRPAGESE